MCAIGLGAAVVLVLAGWGWAISAPGLQYELNRHLISDLGAVSCHDRDARWVCSPRHAVFNVCFVGAGALCAAVAAGLRGWNHWVRGCLAVLGAGLMVLGAVPVDVWRELHMVGLVLAIPGSGAMLLVSGVTSRPPSLGSVAGQRLWAGATVLGAAVGNLAPKTWGFPVGLSEYVCSVVLFLAVSAEAVRIGGHSSSPPEATEAGPDLLP